MAYVKQLFSQGIIRQDHQDIGEMRQPAHSNNNATSMNFAKSSKAGEAHDYTRPGFRNSDILEAGLTMNTEITIHPKTLIWALRAYTG